ncbi:MAG: DNRLRE domain-containing protein, partial [Thermodesulfobacteriota bacterium]|nr:DNRLRE domain-containing protein [Thermodesulfobacteriota bacterium]
MRHKGFAYRIVTVATLVLIALTVWTVTRPLADSSCTTVQVRVNQSSDDAEEESSGAVDLTSSDLELINDGGDQVVGMRFQELEVPQGVTIESAYIEFETDETSSDSTSLTFYGQAADDPPTFASSPFNISDSVTRPKTSTSVGWSPGAWNTESQKHQTEDLSMIVQEIVDRDGWSSGNAMVFIVEGSGKRVAESWDGESANAPLLVIEYCTTTVTFQQGVDGYSGTVDTYLRSGSADEDNSGTNTLVVDLDEERHILLRFNSIFGTNPEKIPPGSTILSASLEINVTNSSAAGANLHRMLLCWNDTDTWNDWGSGIQADGTEAEALSESGSAGSGTGTHTIDVTADLQAWSDNPTGNFGWAWLPPATDDSWQFDSAEGGTPPKLTVSYASTGTEALWTAYNDCVYDAGTNSYIGSNVTEYGIGDGFGGSSSGELFDQATGNPTGVTATLTESGGVNWQPSSDTGGADTASDTDAYNTFHGFADMTGVIYYSDTVADWYVDLTFTGLDPTKTYTFATSASRGGSGGDYGDRDTIYTISASSVDAATNASTPCTQEYLGDPLSVWFNTGGNHDEGNVARWTGIEAGADGSFTVRAEAHPDSPSSGRKAYAFDVFMLQEVGVAPPAENTLTVNTVGNGTVTKDPDKALYDMDEDVELRAVPDDGWVFTGWSDDLSGNDTPVVLTMTGDLVVTATFEEVDVAWTAYNDLDPRVPSGSTDNAPNVTEHDYTATNAVLKNFATGADLPVTMSGSYNNRDPKQSGDNADVGDAAGIFGPSSSRIVDLRATSELDLTSWYNTVIFNNLDPAKEYIITLSANRNNYPGARFTKVSIEGADTLTNASSVGVVVNSAASVSFSTGDNSSGYVAKWTGVTAADGSFSIKSEWDDSLGSGDDNTKGYAMSAFRLEEIGAGANTAPEASNVSIGGLREVGQDLTGSYDYFDAEGDLEGTSTFKWFRDDTEIGGATAQTYTLVAADEGTTIKFEVTPVAQAGVSPGTAVLSAGVSIVPPPPGVREDFETGYPDPSYIGDHLDWYAGDGSGNGPSAQSGIGVGGSVGLTNSGTIFTWIGTAPTDHEFNWNDPTLAGVIVGMDFQTNSSGGFDDDRVGWMITKTSTGSDNIFGVQLDPGGSGQNIEAYWDGDTFGDDDGRTSIVDLPALSSNAWYRFRATITKLDPATSARIDVTLTELDGFGNEGTVVASGFIEDTNALPNTGTDEIPNPGYFTPTQMWPAYKNHSGTDGNADNAYFEIVTGPANTAPVATNVSIDGLREIGQDLTGRYDYFDADADLEGTSTFKWLRNDTEIGGATAQTYTLVGADEGTTIKFEVTPVAQTGVSPGTAVLSAGVSIVPPPPGVREDFETGYPDPSYIGDHLDWYAGDGSGNGPSAQSGIGVGGSVGLTNSGTIFTWIGTAPTDHEFNWNDPTLAGVIVGMDFQTNSSGGFDDDRVGWMITKTSTGSDNIFGVQLDPGGSGQNIEAYWDGDTFGDDDGRTSIVDLPALSSNAWYRFRATITKLDPATSARIDVTLTELDGFGNEGTVVASGFIEDTNALPNTGTDEIPNPGYFTPTQMWPAYKNHSGTDGNADNAYFEIVPSGPPTIPDAPTDLTATAASSSQVDLAWTDNSDNETGFEMWSADSSGTPIALLDTVGANTTVYPDTGLVAETEYCYLVRAVNGAGESAYTNHDCDTTLAGSLPPAGVTETFDAGFTLGQTVGTHGDWFDDGGGPVVTDGNGCGGSPGLAPAGNIFIWTREEHEFDWNDPDFVGVRLGMDFKTDGNGSGNFDDDRLGWMITDSDIGSTYIFGVQLDHSDGGIVTYWRDSSDERIQDPIVDLTGLTSANTWYRFRAEITKLTDTSAKIDVSLVELDDNCNPVGTPMTGTVDDTSQWDDGTGTPGDRAPDTKYFTGPIWPAFKNYSAVDGAADNAYVEILKRFAFVVVTDPHTSDGYAAVRDNLQQIKSWIDSPTEDMPVPAFMVITGDFPDVWQDGGTDPNETDYIIADVLGEDFLWYPVIGNHEISDDINNFYYIRDTMVPSLPYIVDYGPTGSTNTSYSWDYGNAHFVAINAYWDGTTNPNADHNRDGDIVPELLAWIDADLSVGEENPDRPEFAFVHEPAFPDHRHVGDSLDQYPTNRDAFLTTLNDHDVQALFCGHTHYYEHDVAPEFPLGDLHQVTNGYLRTYDNPTITYVLVHGASTTYKVYLRPDSSSAFALHEEWTIGAGVPTSPPDAPTNLTATATSSSQLDLVWTDNADNESGFEIEWSDDGGATFSTLTTVSANTEGYSDAGLIPLEEYCYRVRATNSAGDSDYTNEACDTTLPGPAIVTFQEGADGYAGTVDTHIMEDEPAAAHGNLESVEWDTDDPSGTGQYKYAVLRFDDIFGPALGQIPTGATIQSATLTYVVFNTGDPANVNEVTVDWAEDVTYDTFGGDSGVQGDEYGTSLGSASGSSSAIQSVDVTASLAAWSSDPSANRGWVFLPTDTDGVDFRSSEYTTSAQRPSLTVEYNAPCTQNADCDDGNPCNGLETCDVVTGICQPGTPVDCPPGTTCNPDTGECEAGPTTLMFQEGDDGYSGTLDTFLQEDAPGNVNGSLDEWEWDDDDPNESNNRNYGLIRFDNIFGSGTDQIPEGAQIVSAILTYTVFDEGVTGDVREMLTDWDESDNLTSLCDGSCDEGIEYGTTSIGSAPAPSAGTYDVDVTSSVQAWSLDPSSNLGWIVVPPSPPGPEGGGAQIRSSEYTDNASDRPKLTVIYEWADSPYPPVVVSPTDGEEGVPSAPDLMVNVTDPDDDTMDVTFFGREVGAGTAESFTIIVLPDTQYYSQSFPETFVDQTDWIVDNREALNIVQVIHVGDVVQNAGVVAEWENADDAMSLLENPATTFLVDGIPYGISPGNHDQNMTNFNNYFGETRFTGRGYYGGHYSGSGNENSFSLFSGGGMDFIVIYLNWESSSNADILNWADGLLTSYSDRRAIVASHYLMGVGDPGAFSSQGQAIYNALKDHPNLFLMVSGHIHGEGIRVDDIDPPDPDHKIHTILADYQDLDNGGNGWLRIMGFSPEVDEITVTTYSPTLGEYGTGTSMGDDTTSAQFALDYDMEGSGPFTELGTVNDVSSGSDASFSWPGLTSRTTYEWHVEVTDGASTTTGQVWSFTTACSSDGECDDNNPCTIDTCNLSTGECEYVDVVCPEGEMCDPDSGDCVPEPTAVTFQEGVNAYSGTLDTFLQEDAPDNVNGSLDEWEWDDDDPTESNNRNYGLIRFDDIFDISGTGTDQIPEGSQIVSAILTYTVFDEGVTGDVREMLTYWDESDNLTSVCGGSCGEGSEYGATSIGSAPAPSAGTYDVDVTSSVQSWAIDPTSNMGWIIVPPSPPGASGGGAQIRSSEYATTADRPKLTVDHVLPTEAPDAPTGLFATAISGTEIGLVWTDNSNNETSFEVERSTDIGGPFSPLAVVRANSESYADTEVVPETEYCYRVRSNNIMGPSAYTDPGCATTPGGQLFIDDFNRGDSDDLGALWREDNLNFAIQSNQVRMTSPRTYQPG